jgi:hypothetical protein
MVQDRSGKQLRRFHVEIEGDVVGDTLTLNEHFVYDDGEKQQRVWHIRRTGNGRYEGTAGDIEGVARGQAAGNAFNWRYSMNVTADGKPGCYTLMTGCICRTIHTFSTKPP